jgi:hypothetical protein
MDASGWEHLEQVWHSGARLFTCVLYIGVVSLGCDSLNSCSIGALGNMAQRGALLRISFLFQITTDGLSPSSHLFMALLLNGTSYQVRLLVDG